MIVQMRVGDSAVMDLGVRVLGDESRDEAEVVFPAIDLFFEGRN
jgi:hypothetical protein